MNDVSTRLAGLNTDHPLLTDDDAAAHAVLVHGRRALRRRRVLQAAAGAGGTACVAALAVTVYAATGNSATSHHEAARSTAPVAPSSTSAAPSTSRAQQTPGTTGLALVAYRGKQLPGYTIKHVPTGYVLQGVSNSVLDIAKSGDHSPLDTFAGKLVVMLNDHPGQSTGTAVTVNGHPARINRDSGVAQLTWNDGKHDVDVQCWNNIKLTDAQLVTFAEGVTITSAAVTGHG